jgi:hypothetical protein
MTRLVTNLKAKDWENVPWGTWSREPETATQSSSAVPWPKAISGPPRLF